MALPGRVEAALEDIYRKHNCGPINDETRQRLSLVSEELTSDTLGIVFQSQHVKSLDGFIKHLLDQDSNGTPRVSSGGSPSQSPFSPAAKCRRRVLPEEMSLVPEAPSPKSLKREDNGGSLHIPPQLLALSELEFKKALFDPVVCSWVSPCSDLAGAEGLELLQR